MDYFLSVHMIQIIDQFIMNASTMISRKITEFYRFTFHLLLNIYVGFFYGTFIEQDYICSTRVRK